MLTHFTPVNFFLGSRKYLVMYMQCFRVYVKTPFAKLSMFFFPGDYMSLEDTKKRRKKYLNTDPFYPGLPYQATKKLLGLYKH